MKFNQTIEINFKSFFLEGNFDCIRIGENKEWILNNFPDPDNFNDMNYSMSIWTYGSIEFHFNK